MESKKDSIPVAGKTTYHSEFKAIEAHRLLYSSKEAAKMCGVSRNTWCRWVKLGFAPMPVNVTGIRRWIASDLEAWCKDLKRKASKQRLEL